MGRVLSGMLARTVVRARHTHQVHPVTPFLAHECRVANAYPCYGERVTCWSRVIHCTVLGVYNKFLAIQIMEGACNGALFWPAVSPLTLGACTAHREDRRAPASRVPRVYESHTEQRPHILVARQRHTIQ